MSRDGDKAETGANIRRLRRMRRRSLTDLAAATGRSVAYLSQVERGQADISVADLEKVTRALGVSLSWFFINEPEAPGERAYVVRHDHRRPVGSRTTGLVEELLSPDLGGQFEMFRSIIEPGNAMERAERRDTEEAGYIVSGELRLFIEEQPFDLAAGDSFRLRGEHYRWHNPGEAPCIVVWVIAPPVY